MKKLFAMTVAVLLLFSVLLGIPAAYGQATETGKTLDIIFSHDTHSHLNTFTTDEAIMPTRGGDWYDGGFWQGLFLHKWGVNNDAILNTWEYLYRTIILCNRSLKHIEDFATIHTDMDVTAKKAEVQT